MSKPRMMEPYTARWHKMAYELLATYHMIFDCKKCGGPVLDGYCCTRCGASEPTTTVEEDKEWEAKYDKIGGG